MVKRKFVPGFYSYRPFSLLRDWLKRKHTLEIKIKNFSLKFVITLLLLLLVVSWFKEPQVIYGDSLGLKLVPIKALEPLQAPVRAEEARIAPVPVPKPPAPPRASYSGTNDPYLNLIISRESGGNPYAVNKSSGACGLGQSLPCAKVLGVCGSLSNVACQIEWVRNYCISRYGSTAAAWAWWQKNLWY